MAMIKCDECGKDIPDKASVCIGCCAPIKLATPLATNPPAIFFVSVLGHRNIL